MSFASNKDSDEQSTEKAFTLAFFDSKKYMIEVFERTLKQINKEQQSNLPIRFKYLEAKCNIENVQLAKGCQGICVFVNDKVDAAVCEKLKEMNITLVAVRAAGFNNVDLQKCDELGISVVRVPAYSPTAVAEHALALLMCINRKLHHAYTRNREGNFTLNGLVGFDIRGKTVGVIGTGNIGLLFASIMSGMGCKVLCYDLQQRDEIKQLNNTHYTTLDDIYRNSDIISLHVPLFPSTRHMINASTLSIMKPGVILINTSRGPLINTKDLVKFLKMGRIGGAGLDVYELEERYFFEDRSGDIISDDTLVRLLTFPNVLVTSHQGFLTHEALNEIAHVTLTNCYEYINGKRMKQLTNTLNKKDSAESEKFFITKSKL